MWICLVLPIFAAAADSQEILTELSDECQTGTLIFSEGDCLAVKVFSKSRFTHCAAVVIEDGTPMVYDSMNGVGVRRTGLVEYLRLQTPSEIHVVHPSAPLSALESQAFRDHLHSQLGRKYGIKHHVTGRRAAGIHCAEYCTDALMAAKKIEATEPSKVSPGSLYEGLMSPRLYTDGGHFVLKPVAAEPTTDESWCGRTWRETCECTTGCCRQMSRWFFCRDKCVN